MILDSNAADKKQKTMTAAKLVRPQRLISCKNNVELADWLKIVGDDQLRLELQCSHD